MLPFGIGFSEVLLILVVLLLVVGPQKLPELARTLGKGVRAARRAGQELRDAVEIDEIRRSVYDHTVRPWQQATDIDDVELDDRGTYARAAGEVAAATDAAIEKVKRDGGSGPDVGGEPSPDVADDSEADPDESGPRGPIARGPGPIMPVLRPARPNDDADPPPADEPERPA